MNEFFFKDTVYVSDKQSQEEVFEQVYQDLLKKELVTEDFLENLLERERNYPTGLDLSPVSKILPDIAIPHTESEFVRTTRIIPIKVKNEIPFYNMISPSDQISASFLFMILNEMVKHRLACWLISWISLILLTKKNCVRFSN